MSGPDVSAGAPVTGIRVRTAAPADARGIALVHVRTWQEAYRGLLPQAFLDGLDPARREQQWRRLLAGDGLPRTRTVVAEDGSGVVGFVNVGPSRDDDADAAAGEVTSIYVLPRAWGDGVGRILMEQAVQLLSEAAFTEATLWVLEGNEQARRFYRAAGWHADGTAREERIGGAPAREVRYRRTL